MKFPTVIDRDEDGMWVVECPAIPGCVSQGRTREEAMENINDAIAACLEVHAEDASALKWLKRARPGKPQYRPLEEYGRTIPRLTKHFR